MESMDEEALQKVVYEEAALFAGQHGIRTNYINSRMPLEGFEWAGFYYGLDFFDMGKIDVGAYTDIKTPLGNSSVSLCPRLKADHENRKVTFDRLPNGKVSWDGGNSENFITRDGLVRLERFRQLVGNTVDLKFLLERMTRTRLDAGLLQEARLQGAMHSD